MKNLIIPQNASEKYYPGVNFDAETGICEIIGESFMESPDQFYMPLIVWINEYISGVGKSLKLILKISYYNTSSSKYILKILSILKEYYDISGGVEVEWQYSIDDEDMADEIKEFSKESGLSISPITIY